MKKNQETNKKISDACEICGKVLINGQKHLIVDGTGEIKTYCEDHERLGKK
jgi:hypothetical protein